MSSPVNPQGCTRLAAYAVALATAVGGAPNSVAEASHAIRKIERYCTASWRNAGIHRQDWEDCTQQALAELLERGSREQLTQAIEDAQSEERRELNRAVWRTAQRWRRAERWSPLDETAVAIDGPSQPAREAWEQIVAAGERCLSRRQQQILTLAHDGWHVAEIAERLCLSPARVSDEKYKAIMKLREFLRLA